MKINNFVNHSSNEVSQLAIEDKDLLQVSDYSKNCYQINGDILLKQNPNLYANIKNEKLKNLNIDVKSRNFINDLISFDPNFYRVYSKSLVNVQQNENDKNNVSKSLLTKNQSNKTLANGNIQTPRYNLSITDNCARSFENLHQTQPSSHHIRHSTFQSSNMNSNTIENQKNIFLTNSYDGQISQGSNSNYEDFKKFIKKRLEFETTL